MFVHAGFRALWPAIFLLPWFIFGITCLFEPLLHRRSRRAAIQRVRCKSVSRLAAAWGRRPATGRLEMHWRARPRRGRSGSRP